MAPAQKKQDRHRLLWQTPMAKALGAFTCTEGLVLFCDNDPNVKIAEFHAWLKQRHGVDVEALGVCVRSDDHGGLGLYATHSIEPGERLAEIPITALLTAKAAKCAWASRSGVFQRALEVAEGEELLWLYMIWGRQEPSCNWHPYLQLLPRDDPLSWLRNPEALQWLRGTPLEGSDKVLKMQQQRHERLREILGDLAGSFEDWLWARHCYLSRSFDQAAFPRSEDWGSAAMVPLLDSMNHHADAQVQARYGEEMAGLWLPNFKNSNPYNPGDEVFHRYKRCADNGTLLLSYGFCVPQNPHDHVDRVIFEKDPGVSLAALEAALPLPPERLADGRVLIPLEEALTSTLAEPSEELLRAAALVNGQDYEENSASCHKKAQVCHWLLKALRAMMQSTAFEVHPKFMAMVNSSGTLGRFASRVARHRLKVRHDSLGISVLPSKGHASRAAAEYALSHFRILHRVATNDLPNKSNTTAYGCVTKCLKNLSAL
ncbi:unnamed protein product [Cladocopium goreaui]|uniref:N-lysine methyltransferase SETD6 (SE T domain-containing protein 6) n=1 Tax=Cladocopium goreaui TaxID=2562237 RepID=A0A9P1GJ82_9DINO|nr:unnamed protein product [Cladocopium goreaui]